MVLGRNRELFNSKVTKKCGKCGQVGHNKRTCGKQQVSSKMGIKKVNGDNRKGQVNQNKVALPKMTNRNMVSVWDAYLSKKEMLNENTSIVNGEGDDVGDYTAEELTTLWMLTDGNLGKQRAMKYDKNFQPIDSYWDEGNTDRLYEFVQNIHKTSPKLPTKVWYEFFKPFGAYAKTSLIYEYPKAYWEGTAKKRLSQMTNEELPVEGNAMPPQLFAVFAKDASKSVRETIATREGLPKPIAAAMVLDKELSVVKHLAANGEQSEEVLTAIYHRVKSEEMYKKRDGRVLNWLQEEGFVSVYKNLAENPSTTVEVLHELLTAKMHNHIRSQYVHLIYRNRKISKKTLTEKLNENFNALLEHEKTFKEAEHLTARTINTSNLQEIKFNISVILSTGVFSVEQNERVIDQFVQHVEKSKAANVAVAEYNYAYIANMVAGANVTSGKLEEYYERLGSDRLKNKDLLLALISKPNIPESLLKKFEEREKEESYGFPIVLSDTIRAVRQRVERERK